MMNISLTSTAMNHRGFIRSFWLQAIQFFSLKLKQVWARTYHKFVLLFTQVEYAKIFSWNVSWRKQEAQTHGRPSV